MAKVFRAVWTCGILILWLWYQNDGSQQPNTQQHETTVRALHDQFETVETWSLFVVGLFKRSCRHTQRLGLRR